MGKFGFWFELGLWGGRDKGFGGFRLGLGWEVEVILGFEDGFGWGIYG